MNDLHEHEDWQEIEALVRSAGRYVQPSEELRPRVLELARTELHRQRTTQQLWSLMISLMVAAVLLSAIGTAWHPEALNWNARGVQVAEKSRASTSGSEWNMVDSFVALRRRQASLLSLTK